MNCPKLAAHLGLVALFGAPLVSSAALDEDIVIEGQFDELAEVRFQLTAPVSAGSKDAYPGIPGPAARVTLITGSGDGSSGRLSRFSGILGLKNSDGILHNATSSGIQSWTDMRPDAPSFKGTDEELQEILERNTNKSIALRFDCGLRKELQGPVYGVAKFSGEKRGFIAALAFSKPTAWAEFRRELAEACK